MPLHRYRKFTHALMLGAGLVALTCACARGDKKAMADNAGRGASTDTVEEAAPTSGDAVATAADRGKVRANRRRAPGGPNRRATVEVLPGDLVAGPPDAPVTVAALLRLTPGEPSPALHTVVRLMARARDENLRVVFRPRLDVDDATDLRLARVFRALPDDGARLTWLGDMLVEATDPWRTALRLVGSIGVAVMRGDAPSITGSLQEALREQQRLGVDDEDVVFVNGQRLDPVPAETEILFAARREAQRLVKAAEERAEDPASTGRAFGQAEEVGPRVLTLPAAASTDGRLDVVAFVDFKDPYSRNLASHLDVFFRESPVAGRTRLRLAAFPLDRHAGATEAAAVAACVPATIEASRVLSAFFGDPYDRPDVRPEGLCDALHLTPAECDATITCATRPATAERVLGERAAAEAAGVRGPPALFVEGRRVAPRGRALSRAFLDDVLLGYYLKTWTLPPDGRLSTVPWPSMSAAPDRRSP